jgi:hypothetical protein
MRRTPQARPSQRAGAKGLDSCGAALGMELRPSKLRMPSHAFDMARRGPGTRSAIKDSWFTIMRALRRNPTKWFNQSSAQPTWYGDIAADRRR